MNYLLKLSILSVSIFNLVIEKSCGCDDLPSQWYTGEGEYQYKGWFKEYVNETLENGLYFYSDKRTIKFGTSVEHPSQTFRCTTFYKTISGINYFVYEAMDLTSTVYCNRGVTGLQREAILYATKQEEDTGRVALGCVSELASLASYSVLIKGSPSSLFVRTTSCPFSDPVWRQLTYNTGSGVKCENNKDSTGRMSGGRLSLSACEGDNLPEDSVASGSYACVDYWRSDVIDTDSSQRYGDAVLLARDVDVGKISFHCARYRWQDDVLDLSIAPADTENGGMPYCPRDVHYNKAGDGYVHITLKEYEFCVANGQYIRETGSHSPTCFYKECIRAHDYRLISCPTGKAIPEDFTVSWEDPCTIDSQICATCSVPPALTSISSWLIGTDGAGNLESVTFDENSIREYPQSNNDNFDKFSCLSAETMNNGLEFYYLRYNFLDTSRVVCATDEVYAESDKKFVLHREAELDVATSAAECRLLIFPYINTYQIYMEEPLDSSVPCPFNTGIFQVMYSIDESRREQCYGNRESLATISTKTINLNTCSSDDTFDYPLQTELKCIGQLSSKAIDGSASSSESDIVFLQRSDSSQIIYCARYKTTGDTLELSINVNSFDRIECVRGTTHDKYGDDNSNRFRYFRISPLPPTTPVIVKSSTLKTPAPTSGLVRSSTINIGTTTTTTTTTTPRPSNVPSQPSIVPTQTTFRPTVPTTTTAPTTIKIIPPVTPAPTNPPPSVVPTATPPTTTTTKATTKATTTTTTKAPTTTTLSTTTTAAVPTTTVYIPQPVSSTPDSYHVQFLFDQAYVSHVKGDQSEYARFLAPQVASKSGVAENRIAALQVRRFPAQETTDVTGQILFDFDVNPLNVRRRKRADNIDHDIAAVVYRNQVNVNGNFQVSDRNEQPLTAVKGTAYVWKDDDPCPTETCAPNGKCMIYQGVYTCICNVGFEGTVCAQDVTASGASSQITTYVVVGAILAVVLVLVIVVVVCLRHSCCGKKKEEDTSSTEPLDADDEASLFGKRATAYHNTAFSTGSEGGTLRSLTSLSKAGKNQQEKDVETIRFP